jgi:hypothetical protein
MNAVNDEAPCVLVWTTCLTTEIMCDEAINMLTVDFVFISLVFQEFIGTTFSTLKLATKQRDYFFVSVPFIFRRLRVCFSCL